MPQPIQKAGKKPLAHLQKPTLIAAVGFGKSGKSGILNMMLDNTRMPEVEKVPIVERVFGNSTRIICELGDGTTQVSDGIAEKLHIPEGTMRLSQQIPHSDLKHQSYVEVPLADTGLRARYSALTYRSG